MAGWQFGKEMKINTVRSYFKSIIAILLVVSALMSTTYAWLENQLRNSLYSNSYITVSADGLIVEEDGEIKDSVPLKKDFDGKLTECTSLDGRNFYFPLSNFDEENNPVFRRADANDRNSKYISLEFSLTSDKDTDVWLSNESYILGRAANAVRISLDYADEASSVIILDGSEVKETETSLRILDANGNVLEEGIDGASPKQISHSLNNYFYSWNGDASGNVTTFVPDMQLMTLKSGETRKITVNVWLEGWDSDCVSDCEDNCKDSCGYCDVYNKGDLQINLKFTVGLSDPKVFKFSDTSAETWTCVKELYNYQDYWQFDKRRVFLCDKDTGAMYAMNRASTYETINGVRKYFYHWTATVPSTVINVKFIRLDHRDGVHFGNSSEEKYFEFWDAGSIEGTDLKTYRRFYALEGGNLGNTATNVGRWSSGLSVLTIYFFDYLNEGICDTRVEYSAQCNYYGTDAKALGTRMTYVTTLDSGAKVYAARVPIAASEFKFIQGDLSYSAGTRSSSSNVYSSRTQAWATNRNYPTN